MGYFGVSLDGGGRVCQHFVVRERACEIGMVPYASRIVAKSSEISLPKSRTLASPPRSRLNAGLVVKALLLRHLANRCAGPEGSVEAAMAGCLQRTSHWVIARVRIGGQFAKGSRFLR